MIKSSLLSTVIFVMIAAQLSLNVIAYPAFLVLPPPSETRHLAKRAFDRLDISPFDFGSLSKRYTFEDDDDFGRSKKAFDRLEESGFGFGLKKRAFDRLEHSVFDFGGKRSIDNFNERPKRPFDRLDGSNFGMLKKRSITDLSKEPNLEPFLNH